MKENKQYKKLQLEKLNGTIIFNVNEMVTRDETWLHYYDIPSKSRSKVYGYWNMKICQ